MKTFFTFIISLLLLGITLPAQTPQEINFQGVARDADGNILAGQAISLQLSILTDSASGPVMYTETHEKNTDATGLFDLQIGQGSVVFGNFGTIQWNSGLFFLKVEISFIGSAGSELVGTSQLVSVPYALQSKTSDDIVNGQNTGDMLYWNGTHWINIPAGNDGQLLMLNNGVPGWVQKPAQLPVIITTELSGITNVSAISGGNVSDGGAPVLARGVCWSTATNPTIANSKTSDGTGSGVFTSNLTGLSEITTFFVRSYATNSLGTGYGNQLSFSTTAWMCGSSTISHGYLSGISPANSAPFNSNYIYNTVQANSAWGGKCWTKKNLGAPSEATSATDANADHAGWYFQFNRKQGYYHNGSASTPVWTTTEISENTAWSSSNDPCTQFFGSGWRIPSQTEWAAFRAASISNGGMNNGTYNDAYNSALKLHTAGYLHSSAASLINRGELGYYWSNTQNSITGGWYLVITGATSNVSNVSNKAFGLPLRCIKD